MRAVVYGAPRGPRGATTFSGSLGFGDVRAYLGADYQKKVYFAFAGIHGGEFEGIMGIVNLLEVLETGHDLRGKQWPDITRAAAALDRLVLLPIANVDGRARIPVRMLRRTPNDLAASGFFNTGAWSDGSPIGWPACKQFIPLDFSRTQFPGGYPNDAGVNFQHDDFFGHRQPETEALLGLTARERPDLTLNMHTGNPFTLVYGSFIEPGLSPAFHELYTRVESRLASEKLAPEKPPSADQPSHQDVFNLETALNLNCGTLAVLIESPDHSFSPTHTPENLLDAQLIAHQECMRFLGETGGRYRWTPKPK